jgi:hypothetical protein
MRPTRPNAILRRDLIRRFSNPTERHFAVNDELRAMDRHPLHVGHR